MAYEDTADLTTMPPAPVEGVEERNRRLIRESGGMSTMPAGGGMPPAPVGQPDANGWRHPMHLGDIAAKSHPTMPPNVPGPKPEPTAPDLSKMPPNTFAPPSASGAAPARPADTGAALGMPPAEKPADVRSSAFQTMPPNVPGPAEKHEAELRAQGRPGSPEGPDLPWWKRVLDTIAQSHPIGRMIERNIPGSPGNFDWELARATAAGEKERGAAKANRAEDLNTRNVESEIRHRDTETDQLEAKPEHQDIVKEFSDALAKGDQSRIDALAPRVKQFMETSQKPAREPAEKNTKEQLQAQIADADAKGDKATVKTLQARLKAIDPEGQQRMQITVAGQAAANTRAEKAATRGEVREHDKAYVQPAEGVEKSYQMMDSAYKEYQAARALGKELPTGAQSMLALSTHLSTTFGNVKGSRVTKDMIEHHLGARSISDSALVAIQRLTNGDVLSPEQWKAFHDLIGESRKLSWQTAEKQAKRKGIPVDFLPDDLKGGTAENGGALPPGWK